MTPAGMRSIRIHAGSMRAIMLHVKAEADRRDYKHILKEEDMVANTAYAASEDTSAAVAFEDDFM